MNIIILRCFAGFVTICFLILLSYNLSVSSPLPTNNPCIATVKHDLIYDNISVNYVLSHKIVTVSGNSGYDTLRGTFTVNDKHYIVGRTIKFTHEKIFSSNSHDFQIVSTHKFPSDNLPDDIANRFLSYLKNGPSRFLHLDRTDQLHILISDTGGPSFICKHS
ncbi:FidL-like protein [Enterobacter bugandensis]|uniref:FidL-like protein n=1 Tax=Enterobacter bugandensis TaxID=881260 RepID=UPI003872C50C